MVKGIAAAGMLAALCAMAEPPLQAPDDAGDYAVHPDGAFVFKHYPKKALNRGEEGTVRFSVTLDRNERVIGCAVTESSGFPALDTETCELIVRYARIKPIEGVARKTHQDYAGAVVWTLPAGLTKAAPPKRVEVAAATLSKGKLICRMSPKLGSALIQVRQCHTQEEWNLAVGYAQTQVREMQEIRGRMGGLQ